MVRGVSRRVIVVKTEQPALFEQAIFLVRDYNAPRGGAAGAGGLPHRKQLSAAQTAVEKKGGRSFSAGRILGWRTAHRHHLGADGARFVNRL